jgi:hypothetical protein
VYLDALDYLNNELRVHPEIHELLNSKTTINDIKAAIDIAQERYDALTKYKKAWKWL